MSELKLSDISSDWEYFGDTAIMSDDFKTYLTYGSVWNYKGHTYITYTYRTYEFIEDTFSLESRGTHATFEYRSVWTDGVDFYATNSKKEVYKLDGIGQSITWKKISNTNLIPTTNKVFVVGSNVFCVDQSSFYKLDNSYKVDGNDFTWNPISNSFKGLYDIWSDSFDIYSSYYNTNNNVFEHYKFNIKTNEWKNVEWNMSNFQGSDVIHYNNNVYVSTYRTSSNNDYFDIYKLYPEINEWKQIEFNISSDEKNDFKYLFLNYRYGDGKNTYEGHSVGGGIINSNNYMYKFISEYAINRKSQYSSETNSITINKIYRTKILSIGDSVVIPPIRNSIENVGGHIINKFLHWRIGNPNGIECYPQYKNRLNWVDTQGNLCGCGECKESDDIADSGYLYLEDNKERIPYQTNKLIRYAHPLSGNLETYFPLWTTGNIENREYDEEPKTKYIIITGTSYYVADSPTATSGSNFAYVGIKYANGATSPLTLEDVHADMSGLYYAVSIMKGYIINEQNGSSYTYVPTSQNCSQMTFNVYQQKDVVSATYSNPSLHSIDQTGDKYKNFTLSNNGVLVINYNTNTASRTLRKIVIKVTETLTKHRW